MGSKIQVCAEFSSRHPFAEKEAPPKMKALFPIAATPIAGNETHPEGVLPGHGSLVITAVVFVAG